VVLITVGDTPTRLCAKNPKRTSMDIGNLDTTNSVFLGKDRTVAATGVKKGMELRATQHVSFSLEDKGFVESEWWGICASGVSVDVTVEEGYG